MGASDLGLEDARAQRARETVARVALETVAAGGPLEGVLELLCRTIEVESVDRVIACVHPVDEAGDEFVGAVAPSLDRSYREAINGIRVASMIGPCCQAVVTRRAVIVPDMAADPKWAGFVEQAEPYGLRSCWSTPVLANDGKVLGTFALFYPEPRDPGLRDERLVDLLTRAAAIAIERSRAEAALRKLNETLEQRVEAETRERLQIWNVSQDLLAICTVDGTFVAANPAWAATLDWSEAELVGTPAGWLVHADDQERTWLEIERLAAGHSTLRFENRLRAKDGAYHWISWKAASSNGRIYAVGRDVSEQKRVEAALRDSEARFRDYAETASDWLWEIGPDYRFTRLTENAFASDPAGRLGTLFWDHALDRETEPEKWRRVKATLDAREPFRDFVYRTVRGHGSAMDVRASGRPVFGPDGDFRGYRGTGTDVTEIIHAQDALRESERSLRSTIDGIPGFVATLAPNGEVETVNGQIVEYCGQPLEDLKQWASNGTIHPDDLPHLAEVFGGSIASGIPYAFEARLRRFDGAYRWFDIRGIPVRDASGRIVRWYVLLTDIEDRMLALTGLHQMQADFAHMNRVSVMGELAASLSHEIMQPIASARNNARAARNFLDRDPPELGEVREAIDCIVGDADRAGSIVDRIRDHIRKAPPRKERFDLGAAITEMLGLARSAIVRNTVLVRTQLADGLPPVLGDRVQLQQVVLNLILNAVEAMASVEPGGRELTVSSEQEHACVRVAVRDTGPGIDAADMERVFEAFYTTKASGVGMGLSICRSIIDAHGGRLWAARNEPRGAVFQFTVPGA